MATGHLATLLFVKQGSPYYKWHCLHCLLLCQVAGGTGITPMLQVIKAILKNPHDYTQA